MLQYRAILPAPKIERRAENLAKNFELRGVTTEQGKVLLRSNRFQARLLSGLLCYSSEWLRTSGRSTSKVLRNRGLSDLTDGKAAKFFGIFFDKGIGLDTTRYA